MYFYYLVVVDEYFCNNFFVVSLFFVIFVGLHFSRFFRYVDSCDMFTFSIINKKLLLTMSVTRLNANIRNSKYQYIYKTAKKYINTDQCVFFSPFRLNSTSISMRFNIYFKYHLSICVVSEFIRHNLFFCSQFVYNLNVISSASLLSAQTKKKANTNHSQSEKVVTFLYLF